MIVIIIRAALVLYIIYYFATSFSDSELAAVRICQLVTIVLSSLSQSPLFHMSFKSTWLINLRPVDSNYQNRVNNNVPHGNRVHLGNEVRTRHNTIELNWTKFMRTLSILIDFALFYVISGDGIWYDMSCCHVLNIVSCTECNWLGLVWHDRIWHDIDIMLCYAMSFVPLHCYLLHDTTLRDIITVFPLLFIRFRDLIFFLN